MKKRNAIKTIFVALDQSFGSLRLAREKGSLKVYGIDLAPGIRRELGRLTESGLRVVIMLTEALPVSEIKVLSQFLPEADRILPLGDAMISELSESLENGARSARIDRPATAMVVAADRVTRGTARDAGALAAPHLVIARDIR